MKNVKHWNMCFLSVSKRTVLKFLLPDLSVGLCLPGSLWYAGADGFLFIGMRSWIESFHGLTALSVSFFFVKPKSWFLNFHFSYWSQTLFTVIFFCENWGPTSQMHGLLDLLGSQTFSSIDTSAPVSTTFATAGGWACHQWRSQYLMINMSYQLPIGNQTLCKPGCNPDFFGFLKYTNWQF